MKKTLLNAVLLSCFFFLFGCSQNIPPRSVLSKYLDASLHGRKEEAYAYIASQDKNIVSLEEYSKGEIKDPSNFKKVLYENISYKILGIDRTSPKTAMGRVEITTPDFKIMFRDLYTAAFGASGQNLMQQEDLDDIFARRYENNAMPMTVINKTYTLIKENNGEWKVSLDWKHDRWDIDKMEDFFGKAEEQQKGL